MLILLTAMAVLLPLLAALQYYWLGQVSEGASERLQSNLRASAIGFRHDFNREFIRAYLNFHLDSFGLPDQSDVGRYHAERLEQWNQTAPHPRLISEVLAVNYDEQDEPHLSRLDVRSRRFEPVEWTGDFANWHLRFARRDDGAHLTTSSSEKTSLESFAEDIPALIIPFPAVGVNKLQNQSAPLPPGFTIVKLDLNYIRHEFIPSLVRRDLFDDSHTEYNVTIVSVEDPKRVIYSSTYPLADVTSSDVSTRIFGLEADELRTFLSNEGAMPRASAAPQSATRPVRLINLRFLKRSAVNSAVSSNEDEGSWQLLIKHRAGSLAAVVNSARRRNLAISFGILLLLGAGILMTAISTRRAERLARQQINFVAGVSHELRTPLAVICSAGENLAHGIVDSPGKVAQYGEVIHREGKRLTDMVEQVLEFAGAQSGREHFEFRPTDVTEFVDGAVAACQLQIQEKDFKIEKRVEPDLPLIHGDGAALRRVMQNLIGNAVKYGKNNGAQPWALITAQTVDKGNEVKVMVEDGGLGISSSDLPHIFEPFFRGEGAVAAQIEGSGVGLSLVKQIVEAHGGRITVKSTPGTGSVFTFYLPVDAVTEHNRS
jgi:signal transduction histidine kinase